ncbi:hypothetical protein, partial [Helicobacter marmotae]|uniref:hypothetical protein n=1 Tax=Helicobacter marmotae TaxID=152490 RepID=UPI0011C03F98
MRAQNDNRIGILRFLAKAQNDNESQTSFSSETRSHCDKIKSHEVPPLKASSGRGIYKGEGA